jgi:hypothetical protein
MAHMDEKPRRRWFRFSLRTMFVMVTLFSFWLGWQAWIVRERLAMRKWLDDNGGSAGPPMRLVDERGPFVFEQVNTLPFWRRWLGDESIRSVSFPVFPAPSEHVAQLERAKRIFPEARIGFRIVEIRKLPPQ